MVQLFMIHAILQIIALILFIVGIYFSKKHNLSKHHILIFTATILMTVATGIAIYEIGGIPTIHGKIGLTAYIIILGSVYSGYLFRKGKIKRKSHKFLTLTAITLLALNIIIGLYLYGAYIF